MKPREKISWTDDRIGVLKRMWKEGKSAAEIAKAVGKGVTRNAVIGKAHRMGLSGRPSPIKKDAAKKTTAAAAPAARAKKAPAAAKPAAKKVVAPAPAKKAAFTRNQVEEPTRFEKEAVPPGGGVNLIDLTERMCKWPIGDPRDDDFIFCGLGIRPGTPYCPSHAAAAYQTSSRRGGMSPVSTVANDKDDAEDDVDEEEVDTDDADTDDEADAAV